LPEKKNILMVILDCLRADHFDGSGQRPYFARLRGSGCYFSRAFTPIATTTPSVATMLTGLYPHEHGIVSLSGYKLHEACVSLPELLAGAGYDTLAFVTGPLLPETGLARGFKTYRYRPEKDYFEKGVRREVTRAINGARRPWFAMLHLWELHGPIYERPSLLRRLRRKFGPKPRQIPPGGADVAYAARYERCLPVLEDILTNLLRDIRDIDLLIVLGDHGERLAEEQRPEDIARCRWTPRHGFNVYDYLLHMPLLLAGPGIPARVVEREVSTVDLAATIAGYAGLTLPGAGRGTSLLPAVFSPNGAGAQAREMLCSATGIILKEREDWLEGIRDGRYKYVCQPYSPEPREYLYDLAADPAERVNIVAQHHEVAERLRRRLAEVKGSPGTAAELMSEAEDLAVRAKLEDLGYI
jgi:arylsulfatase A-like enzyme